MSARHEHDAAGSLADDLEANVKPGLTDLPQVGGFRDTIEKMQQLVEYDLQQISHFILDLRR